MFPQRKSWLCLRLISDCIKPPTVCAIIFDIFGDAPYKKLSEKTAKIPGKIQTQKRRTHWNQTVVKTNAMTNETKRETGATWVPKWRGGGAGMRDGFLMIKEVSLCVCVWWGGGLMERVWDTGNDKSVEVVKQEIMKWRERGRVGERAGGDVCLPGGTEARRICRSPSINSHVSPAVFWRCSQACRPTLCVWAEERELLYCNFNAFIFDHSVYLL